MRKPIIAVDFDDTICRCGWPTLEKAEEVPGCVAAIKRLRELFDFELIIWTCRHREQHIANAKTFLQTLGIEYDYFNENAQSMIDEFGDCRKVFADVMIDDCALPPTIGDHPAAPIDWDLIVRKTVDRLLVKGFKIKNERS